MICISTRRIFATVAAVLCLSTWVLAADDIQVGPDGNPGTPGINGNPPVAGGNGDDGGSASADAGAKNPNSDAENTDTATGGNGGEGGQGGDASASAATDSNGIIPEPATSGLLSLFAAGALGIRAWRKRSA